MANVLDNFAAQAGLSRGENESDEDLAFRLLELYFNAWELLTQPQFQWRFQWRTDREQASWSGEIKEKALASVFRGEPGWCYVVTFDGSQATGYTTSLVRAMAQCEMLIRT